MKKNEEKYLKKVVTDIRKYARNNLSIPTFFDNIGNFNVHSLQDLSFQSDLKFFKDVNFVLSVITSIVSKPIYANIAEEIIVRSSQASNLQSDMFIKTIKDARMWKRKGLDMTPEHVYYQQYTDDLKIYENIFIVHLINLIDNELMKYQEFYASIIKTFDGSNTDLTLNTNKAEDAIMRLNTLYQRLTRIKATHFYKEINSKCNTDLIHIAPTNILLKNRLYNSCFKFYRRIVSYDDERKINKDFLIFYYVIILKQFKKMGLKLLRSKVIKDANSINGYTINLMPNLTFYNDDLKITLNKIEDEFAFSFLIEFKKEKCSSNHLLYVDKDDNFNTFDVDLVNAKDSYDSISFISIWSLAELEEKINKVSNVINSEEEMIEQYVKSRTELVDASQTIYSHYCPICKSKNIEENNGTIHCDNCHSIYRFSNVEKDKIIFIKVRRI